MIIMREQLNVKQKQAISETPAKDGGGLGETCFSSFGRTVAFPGKRPWLGCRFLGLSNDYLMTERLPMFGRRVGNCPLLAI
jgi:hypothetical protein